MRNNGMIVTGLVIVLAVTLAGLAFMLASTGMTYGGGMMNGTWTNGMMRGTWTNGMMGGWGVFGALVIGGALLAILWFARRPGSAHLATPGRESPLDVLKLRYAKGEITSEQLEKMRLTINP